jgi:hypothetical protein
MQRQARVPLKCRTPWRGSNHYGGTATLPLEVAATLNLIPAGSQVLVNLDVDGLDSGIVPAVISPDPIELTYRHLVASLRIVALKAEFCGFNLVKSMLERDHNGTSAYLAARIVLDVAAPMARKLPRRRRASGIQRRGVERLRRGYDTVIPLKPV